MSGQTYTTIIRIPTPQELAAQVATAARAQGVASADGFGGQQFVQAVAQLRAQALQHVVATIATVAAPIAGTARGEGPTTAQVEIGLQGARVPMRVDVDPADPTHGRVTLSFADTHGPSCSQEARLAADVFALFAQATAANPDPSAGAAVSSPLEREAGR